MKNPLFPHYQRARATFPRKPEIALRIAREELAAGKPMPRFSPFRGPGLGAPFEVRHTAMQWCERPESMGLRLVGYVDEITAGFGKLVDHKGWFLRDDGWDGETARGVVYLLPGRNGTTRAVAGIADPYNDGQAVLALADIQESESNGDSWSHSDAVREAGRLADQLAESYAEHEREHDSAWRAGAQWADAGEELSQVRSEFLAVAKEAREHDGPKTPALCAAVQARLTDLADQWRTLKERRATLLRGDAESCYWWPGDARLCDAFNDAAGERVAP